ncbi:uncharacterized protein DS421_20g696390 [Arachis hypogaea]|nr:uncharacterized protein DS421_20g696390 [Arachis hypogaea]
MSSKAKQSLKISILKQESGDLEVIQKIDQLLNHLTTVPKTPTNSGESTSRIQTRSSKVINALGHDSNDSSSDLSDDSGKSSLKVSPIMTNSITKWKGLTKPPAYGYNRISAPEVNDQNEPILGDDGEPILDVVNTLIFTIASHFIGDPSLWKDC